MTIYIINICLKKFRNSSTLFLIIPIYFYLFLPISANSQSDSLIKYLEIAAKNNPSVLQKFAEYQAALQKIPQAGSLSDPELTAGVFLSPMELVNGNQVADIKLMQMFPWFGVLKFGKDEMSLMAKAKFELFRDAKLQVFYEVQRSWYELYKVQNDISISEKNLEILKIIERLALVKYRTTSSTGTEATPSNTVISSGTSQNNSAGSSGIAPVVALQKRRHGLEAAAEEQVEQECLKDVIRVVAEGDLRAPRPRPGAPPRAAPGRSACCRGC